MGKWWGQLSYTVWMYFALLLPLTALIYQLVEKEKRKFVLLISSWIFFFTLSKFLLIANIVSSIFVWKLGLIIDGINSDKSLKRKERKRKKQRFLILGILALVLVLLSFKYLDFLGESMAVLLQTFGIAFGWTEIGIIAPVGISYYTLESIAYLSDIYWEKTRADGKLINIALFMSFFPKLIEGPITRYDSSLGLFTVRDIRYENLAQGYQRILWGLFKKLVVADQLAPGVEAVYGGNYMDGGVALFAALIFTIQEYMDFSGAIDIAIGSAKIFGIKLLENFTQPFFAKNAGDFWHRWHITLGAFFRDYVFYPVSLSRKVSKISKNAAKIIGNAASRFVTPAIALFAVWSLSGLWHGPRWTYVFYGLYYFVLILIENILEKPFLTLLEKLRLSEASIPVRIFRGIKLLFIVIIGEMFFRAETLIDGFDMFTKIFTDLRFDMLFKHLENINIDRWGYVTIILGTLLVAAVDVLKEAGFPIRRNIERLPKPLRFAFWYVCIFVVIIFGAYGTGYDSVDLIYAQF
ncbi:MAG: MBOAT family protein [Lachnospiraceae bacterium]|nr:MBOAT family protein [Lachnospiraceae bacterium]